MVNGSQKWLPFLFIKMKIMELRKSERKQAKIKLALQGASGSGKTYSSLLIAYGMTKRWDKIAIIDSENGSADLYAHLGSYNVLNLSAPFNPESYIEAIEICEQAGMEVIIIDSISQCWDFLLEFHAGLQGNSFANWGKITPRQNAFVQKILSSSCHIIATMRTKQDYVLNQKDGKFIPEKVGLKSVQRDGIDYEFTLVFDIDMKHNVNTSKDRTELFMGKPEFVITSKIGETILEWCNSGANVDSVRESMSMATTIEELNQVYHNHPEWYQQLTPDFLTRKQALQVTQNDQTAVKNPVNFINYGNHAINAGQN